MRIGYALGSILRAGDCVSLNGDLGCGKTCFTQGIARALGVPDDHPVNSPTFTILNEYRGRDLSLYHLDAYRLSGVDDLQDIGFFDYLNGDGVLVIEWGEKIAAAINGEVIAVDFTYIDDSTRKLEFRHRVKIGILKSALGMFEGPH